MTMAETLARRENVVAKVPALAMANRFSRYAPEAEQPVRAVQVTQNTVLEALKMAWRECDGRNSNGYWLHHSDYVIIKKTIKPLKCSAEDIAKFSVALTEFQDEKDFDSKAGFFLSALINNCKEDKFVIPTSQFSVPLFYLGYKNKKSITVEGFGGNYLGRRMADGIIIVNGNAGWCTGQNMAGGHIRINGHVADSVGAEMKAGTIRVNGNAGFDAGHWMRGGTVVVHGSAGDDVGKWMAGGSLHINEGGIRISTRFRSGKIFHKGVLIVDK
jgi:hypothetical protein